MRHRITDLIWRVRHPHDGPGAWHVGSKRVPLEPWMRELLYG
jgi:hypothetical protein